MERLSVKPPPKQERTPSDLVAHKVTTLRNTVLRYQEREDMHHADTIIRKYYLGVVQVAMVEMFASPHQFGSFKVWMPGYVGNMGMWFHRFEQVDEYIIQQLQKDL